MDLEKVMAAANEWHETGNTAAGDVLKRFVWNLIPESPDMPADEAWVSGRKGWVKTTLAGLINGQLAFGEALGRSTLSIGKKLFYNPTRMQIVWAERLMGGE